MDAGNYLTKVASDPGAGDILMGFLGSVILSFAFSMFKKRKVKKKKQTANRCSVLLLKSGNDLFALPLVIFSS